MILDRFWEPATCKPPYWPAGILIVHRYSRHGTTTMNSFSIAAHFYHLLRRRPFESSFQPRFEFPIRESGAPGGALITSEFAQKTAGRYYPKIHPIR